MQHPCFNKIVLPTLAILGIFLFFLTAATADSQVVLINEICWMGSQISANDEWLELYNPTASAVDLTGWKLVAIDGSPEIVLSGQIQPNQYFLLERTDDNSVPDITANDIYTGALGNDGEYLQLLSADNSLIDEAIGWQAGDNAEKLTMSRQTDFGWANSSFAGGTPGNSNTQNTQEINNQETNDYPSALIINELLPNPSDEALEWIELKNLSNANINLNGWSLTDSSGKRFVINNIVIAGNSLAVFQKSETKISLNNSGDVISLFNPAYTLVYSVEYENSYDKWSYARDEDDSWQWTTLPTKLEENQFSLPTVEAPINTGGSPVNTGVNYSDVILISEILPNPTGSDSGEWIELYNSEDKDVDLIGWQVGDNSSKKYIIAASNFESTVIKAKKFFILPRSISAIALNNTGGDAVKLYWPNGSLLDNINYFESAEDDHGYALINNKWVWTSSPTPGGQNILTIKNQPPIVNFEIEGNIVGQPIIFDATESYDPEGEDLIYLWNFGDATTTLSTTTPVISHIFNNSGDYSVVLTVKDILAATAAQEKKLTTANNSPGEAAKTAETCPPNCKVIDIMITELLPNPSGSDTELEWIEIYNAGPTPVDLVNWQLDDAEAGSHPYIITDNMTILPGEYLVFNRPTTKIALNNNYDSVRLFDAQGNLANEVSYNQVAEDASYALDINYNWRWTYVLTPGAGNIADITTLPAMAAEQKSNIKTSLTAKLADVRNFDFGDSIKTEGIVAVEPGTLGKNIFYIVASPPTVSGIQIYCYKKDFPLMAIGDKIEVLGSLSESRGETRLKITDKNNIHLITALDPPLRSAVQIEDIDENLEGALIEIQGELTEAKGSAWWLDDSTEEVKVYIKTTTQIKKGNINIGDTLKITGIVSQWDDEYRVLPRSQKDIEIVSAIKGVTTNKIQDLNNANNKIFKYLLAICCTIIIILASIIIESKKKQ